MPTILEILEVNTGTDYDGRSLIPLTRDEFREPEPEFYITECTWIGSTAGEPGMETYLCIGTGFSFQT